MNDIYDINANILWFPFDVYYTIVFFILFCLVRWGIIFFTRKKNISPISNISWNNWVEWNTKYVEKKDYLSLLYLIHINDPKEIFYTKLSSLLRDFLEEKYQKKISSMTLWEIKKMWLEKNIELLLENIYFTKYAKNMPDNEIMRNEIFFEAKKLLSKE